MPITEYEIYSDERFSQGRVLLGAIVVTEKGRKRLVQELKNIRSCRGLSSELKWAKISKKYLPAYTAWLEVFFKDSFARFVYMDICKSEIGNKVDFFSKFLLTIIDKPSKLKRYWIYHDGGYFHKSSDIAKLRNKVDSGYWALMGGRTIRIATEKDSKEQDIIQLVDILLGAVAHESGLPDSSAKRDFVLHFQDLQQQYPITRRGLKKIKQL